MRDMEEIQNRLASLFGRRLPLRKEGTEEGFTLTEWSPPVDIAEDEKEYTIKAELPGVNKEDVKVTVEGGALSITGERKAEKEEKDKKYHRIERSYGTFVRSFTLPGGAASEKVSAEFKDGVRLLPPTLFEQPGQPQRHVRGHRASDIEIFPRALLSPSTIIRVPF